MMPLGCLHCGDASSLRRQGSNKQRHPSDPQHTWIVNQYLTYPGIGKQPFKPGRRIEKRVGDFVNNGKYGYAPIRRPSGNVSHLVVDDLDLVVAWRRAGVNGVPGIFLVWHQDIPAASGRAFDRYRKNPLLQEAICRGSRDSLFPRPFREPHTLHVVTGRHLLRKSPGIRSHPQNSSGEDSPAFPCRQSTNDIRIPLMWSIPR